ncbi:Bax inhibitor-1/YccA family protein [Dictyobacter kobayashii]|uniref:BAX inhibitor protein n=1 Tax=Dictyobacter kobayashii TaxID=2014872 RepID=A0A402AMJ5_9CHLR|nr:Bax inhibitor-1/YccA family protein [Dictyobacter kobayashii]GCE20357.1 BAX inhibitor protein [Dictyobacter kobayashii]
MFNPNPRNNYPYGNNPYNNRSQGDSPFGSRYQYQTLPYGYQGAGVSPSGLISKVMGLLAFSFVFATLGTVVGLSIGLSYGTYWIVAIAGLVVLIALNMLIQKPGLNLFLLYLFTFLEGLALGPLVGAYLSAGLGNILGQAFVITALTSLGLGLYSWTTKRDFSHLGDYLFFGVILLLVTGLIGIFFHSTLFALVISFFGVAIFSGYVLFYVQRAKYMADTLPNAIGLTVSIFITVLNLFLYILQILSIMSGNRRR